MNLQPTLENELIILKPLSESDFETLYEVAKDPLIWKQHPCPNRYKREAYTKFFEDSIQSKGALLIIGKTTGKVIGSTRFKPVDNLAEAIEIGWSFLARTYWGGTYNKAMKQLMIDYAFQSIEDIIFYIGKDNIRSQKAVEKIGGIEATEPKYQNLLKNRPNDWVYRINRNNQNN